MGALDLTSALPSGLSFNLSSATLEGALHGIVLSSDIIAVKQVDWNKNRYFTYRLSFGMVLIATVRFS